MTEKYDPKCPNEFKLWKQIGNQNDDVVVQQSTKEFGSTVVVVLNMGEELDEEIENDLREEANRYGNFGDFTQYFDGESQFKVQFYVKFQLAQSAEMFVKAMNGRFYDGKKIVAELYREDMFMGNQLGSFNKNS